MKTLYDQRKDKKNSIWKQLICKNDRFPNRTDERNKIEKEDCHSSFG